MNLEQLKARLKEIMASLEQYNAKASFTDEEMEQVNSLSAEFEGLKKQIETAEKIEGMKAAAATSVRQVAAVPPVATVGQNRQTLDPKSGFQNSGEFYKAVMQATRGNVDKRLSIQGASAFEKNGEDGGFLIPEDFRTEIQKKVTGDQSLLSMTRQFQTSSNNLTLPTNETAPWDGTGVQAYWEGEGAALVESKAKFGDSHWRLHKLTALVRVSDELLDDAPALESWIKREAPDAMLHKINVAIISGTGAGQPLGILNSGFKFKVLKESGQTADTVNFANVNKMLGRILPSSFPRAVWLIHPALLEQIRAMKFDLTSSTPIPVYMPPAGVSSAPFGTLYGRPIMPMMGGVKAAGDEGDIMLVDLDYYYTAVKTAGIKSDISTHVYFLTNEQAFRFSMRLAGHCPYKAPVVTENGAFSMSGFVTLEDR